MSKPRRTLRRILAEWFFLISLSGMLLQFAYTFYQYNGATSDLIETALEGQVNLLSAAIPSTSAGFAVPGELAALYARYPGNYGFEILGPGNSIAASANAGLFSDIAPQRSETGRATSIRDKVGDTSRIFESASVIVGKSEYLVRAAAVGDPADLQTTTMISEAVDHVMLPIIPLTVFLFTAVLLALRHSLAPVEAAARAVRYVNPAGGGIRLDLRGAPAEIAALGNALNSLLDRLEQTIKSHHDFAANVAHELRTPLSSLLLDLEGSTDPAVQHARSDVRSMSRLVDQLLSISRLEGLDRGKFADINLAAIAKLTAARLAPQALKTGVELEVLDLEDITVKGQAEAVESALRNLVENAIRVAPPGTAVTISVGPGSILSVRNDGPGIAPERLAGLFDRYRQGDRETRGRAGLGLEITKRTIELHGGRIDAKSEPGKGSTFTLFFPD